MKTKYNLLLNNLLLIISIFLFAYCRSEEEAATERNALTLSTTENLVELNEAQLDEDVLTFEWTKAAEIGNGYTFTYLFQLDIADNNFETAISPVTIADGVFTAGFKAGELYDYIVEKWGRTAGEIVRIEARIVAQVNGPRFMYPEIATAKASVQTYIPESQPLYMLGTATSAGLNADNALKMTELSNGRIYSWKGELQPGDFKFITTLGSILPSLNRGTQDGQLVLRTLETDPDEQFSVYNAGLYYIYLSKKEMTMQLSMLKYQNVYLIGNATTAEWDIDKALAMTPDPVSPSLFTIQATLKEGELKMPTEKSWSAPTFRPMQADGSITDTKTQVIVAPDGPDDLKWKVTATQAGTYNITLDTENNTIYFVKI
ncbi:MAG: SusF/SusE family outer membrane protein [Dysgonamonadaceae bacterium]|jgi:uncharacterized protein (DUF2147 family)|nr:SusF/SusE family outer membrane protein [Dysgonamonadaceae bacterium]